MQQQQHQRPPITSHVLDTTRGRPAEGVPLRLERRDPDSQWTFIGQGQTDSDGRCSTLITAASLPLELGVYRLRFDTAAYFTQCGVNGFYPYVEIVFNVEENTQHYHIPLLISPFGYSTYRGS